MKMLNNIGMVKNERNVNEQWDYVYKLFQLMESNMEVCSDSFLNILGEKIIRVFGSTLKNKHKTKCAIYMNKLLKSENEIVLRYVNAPQTDQQ